MSCHRYHAPPALQLSRCSSINLEEAQRTWHLTEQRQFLNTPASEQTEQNNAGNVKLLALQVMNRRNARTLHQCRDDVNPPRFESSLLRTCQRAKKKHHPATILARASYAQRTRSRRTPYGRIVRDTARTCRECSQRRRGLCRGTACCITRATWRDLHVENCVRGEGVQGVLTLICGGVGADLP